MRLFIHIGFDGTAYSGWQRQKNTQATVQEVIEQKLSMIFKKDVAAYGCGRTDAGVHASQYVMHIEMEEAPEFDLKFRLNRNLPEDIAVYEVMEVSGDRHSRYDATARTYDYFLHWKKDPFLIRYSALYEDVVLDFGKMREAAELILKTQDFKPLCKQPDLYKNTVCKISRSELYVDEAAGRLRYSITSNRFLRGMVRLCVFFLLRVGSGKMTVEEFQEILEQRNELKQKQPALPNGLFLSGVAYPFVELSESSDLMRMMRVGLE